MCPSFVALRYCLPSTVDKSMTCAEIGAAGGDRTHDPWLRRPILYPLSYSRKSVALYRRAPDDVSGAMRLIVSGEFGRRPAKSPCRSGASWVAAPIPAGQAMIKAELHKGALKARKSRLVSVTRDSCSSRACAFSLAALRTKPAMVVPIRLAARERRSLSQASS